ncbi:MAG TPA: amino acid adenylation domain-containing protein [Pyrinomonadaceae bacterium]|jgi:amino acid adenylation domain-containing protein|nr:amino acid adenylation domain-containing protein [Pyrinomonadaceae bacterium]
MSHSEPNPLDIAIVGYAGRFPGADNVREFWRNLCAGKESVLPLSDADLLEAGVSEELIQHPNYVKAEAPLSGFECFDAVFFGYGAREALLMDPQQRIFLESCWEALEDAGYDCDRLDGLTGVYAGAGPSNYSFQYLYKNRRQLGHAGGFEIGVGNALSSLTARVSHKLNLSGPSIAVQTACSTSLVAVHLAVQSLLSRECDLALAGAVFLNFPAHVGYLYEVDGILSPDGHCRAFDHRAQGTIFGSGVGVVVLKRFQDAIAAGDSIRAVIKGTAVNNDGALKAGFTAPNQQAQAGVVAEALAAAGVEPGSISYVEAHGTGTALGDPIEISGLKQVFANGAGRETCAIGSVKTNIGHLDAAAGMAGLIKTVLALEHRALPPSINFELLNPNIDLDQSPFFVNTTLRDWDLNGAPLRAGISSFGLGGTNSHVIVEEAPATNCRDEARTWVLIPLAAKSPAALEALTTQVAAFLDENARPYLLHDLGHTYQVGRKQWEYRRFAVGRNTDEASRLLRDAVTEPCSTEPVVARDGVFILPAHADCLELGVVIYNEEPAFREQVENCVSAWESYSGIKCPVNFAAATQVGDKPLTDHDSDLALFFFEYAVAKTLIEWGINPKLIIGDGVGRIVADCLRGSIRLSDAFALLSRQKHVSENAPAGSRNGHGASSFAEIFATLKDSPQVAVELGGSTVTTLASEQPGFRRDQVISLSGSDIERGHVNYLIGKLWANGAKINWTSYAARHRRQRVSAPTYPFEKKRHWLDQELKATARREPAQKTASLSSLPATGTTGNVDKQVKELFQKLLAVDEVAPEDSFTDLGGDSLLATQLTSRLRDTFGIVIPLREILAAPTISGIVRLLKAAQKTGSSENPIQRVSRTTAMNLSFSQQRLWFLDSLDPGSPTYNISSAVRLRGPLDQTTLGRSIEAVVSRHEALRTGFRVEGGEPVQYIEPQPDVSLALFDLQNLPGGEQQRVLHDLMHAESGRGFLLDSPVLFRASLFRLAPRESILLFTIHHIVADGWSLGVLTREVAHNYQLLREGRPAISELPLVQYVDYAEWQRNLLQGETLQKLLSYWRDKLGGELPQLELHTDHPRPPRLTHRGERQFVAVPAHTLQALHELSRREGATLYMVLLAAFSVLLNRYTNQTDLLIGSPIANRNRIEFEDLIGCFVNVLVMRIDAGGNPNFSALLERVKETSLAAYANQDLPFERLVEEIQPARDLSRTPVFQALFVLQNTPAPEFELTEMAITPFDFDPGAAVYDVTLSIKESEDGLGGWLEYNADLFEPATVRRMIGHFQTLLESIASHPDCSIGELEILSEEERSRLLKDLNATGADEVPCTLQEMIRSHALQEPEAIAICYGDMAITYGELERRANQLGNYLRRLGMQPETIVALYMERSIEAIVSILGILKAGAAYLALDPGYPAARLDAILKDAKAPLVVTTQSLSQNLPLTGARPVCIDTEWPEIEREPESPPESGVVPANLAYVVYTSGSTGKPKGVMVSHTGLLNLIRAEAREFGVTPDDRVLLYTSLSFDASLFEICMALGHGAQLVITPSSELLPTPAFVPMLRRFAITNLSIFPSALALLDDDDLPALRTLIVGGEACPKAVADRWSNGRQMFNTYGTSETTIWATSGHCDQTEENMYIGRALRNTRIYVLDPFMNPTPAGVPGEIYVGGIGVARGYVEMSDLTAERFVPDSFSEEPGQRMYRTGDAGRLSMEGNIELLGRLDHQIKVQGVRIELRDVEAAVLSHPAVKHAVAHTSGEAANKLLVVYFVSSERDGSDASDIHDFLSHLLPAYMIPSIYIPLEKLPLLPGGKTDYRALSLLDAPRLRSQPQYSAPETDLKRQIAALVQETLGVAQIGTLDNLFSLGAHSLKIVQLKSRLDSTFGSDLPIIDLFQRPTVNGIAELIDQAPKQDTVVALSPSRARLRQQLREQRTRLTT